MVSIFKVIREEKADGRTGCIIQGKRRLGNSHSKVNGGGRKDQKRKARGTAN